MISFNGRHFNQDMILQSVRLYLAYSLSYRDIEEIMIERRFEVNHSTVNRWVVHDSPQLEKSFHQKKKHPGCRRRMDETYTKVKSQRRYYYRAINKENKAIDFLIKAKRYKKAVLRFFNKAID